MLICSPELQCSNEILTIAAMLSGDLVNIVLELRANTYFAYSVQSVWRQPIDHRKEADAAKVLLSISDSDHLTLLNVYNSYMQSEYVSCW